eukprot:g6914.t1
MPPSTPRGHRGLAEKGTSLQTQACIRAATKPAALAACPVSTTPSCQGAGVARSGGGGGGAAEVLNQNMELKCRQKELETMVKACEAATSQLQEENSELRRRNIKAQADAERAKSGADETSEKAAALRRDLKTAAEDAKAARAEIAGLRREARTAGAEAAGLRREVEAARDEAARARDEAEVTMARAEAAELAAARANEELGRVKEAAAAADEAARKAAKELKAEVVKATEATAVATAAAQKAVASAKAAAAAEVAAACSRADAARDALAALQAERETALQQQQQQPQVASLAARLEALAARSSSTEAESSSHPKPGKKRGRGAATATALAGGRGGGSHKTASVGDGEGHAELPEITKGFCAFLSAYTVRDLPLHALVQLIEAAPSLGGKREVAGEGDDCQKSALTPVQSVVAKGSKSKPRAVAVRQDRSASAMPAPAAAACGVSATPPPAAAAAVAAEAASATSAAAVVVTTPESTVPTARPTTSRREMLNSRRAQQEKEAREKQRAKEEQEKQKAERQREARQKRKKEAARQKAAEAAAREQEAAKAALEAVAMVPSCSMPPLRQQEQEQRQPQHKQNQRKESEEGEGQKRQPRAQSTKSRRAKQAPSQQHQQHQPQQQHVEAPAQPQDREVETTSITHAGTGPMTQSSPAAGIFPSVSTAEAPPTKDANAVVHTSAAPLPPADKDEAGAFVEEVPMPTGDIDDGFFCADVGVGGVDGAVGLIVGGGGGDGDGYGMVDSWSHRQDESTAVVGSSGAPDAGGKRRKGKGRPRKPETVTGSSTSPVQSVDAGEGNECGDGKEGKKKRRRSMRMIKAPVKFGSEEPLAEVDGVVPRAGPKRDHLKSPEPGLATLAAGAASPGVTGSSEYLANQTDVVAPTLISDVPSSTSGDAAPHAASTRSVPSGTAVDGVSAAPGSAVATASSVVVSVDSTAQCQAPPAKRKLASTVGSKRNIRTIRFRGGGLPATSGAMRPPPPPPPVGAAAAAASPPSREMQQTNAGTSDPLAAAAAPAATEAAASLRESMFATAAVAKRELDNLFDTAALKLMATPPSDTAAAQGAGGGKEKSPRRVDKGAELPAGTQHEYKAKAAAAAAVAADERLLPFGDDVSEGVTSRDIFEAASSRSWVSGGGGAAEGGPRGVLTGVLAAAQVLMEKHFRVPGSDPSTPTTFSAVPPEATRHFQSFLAAIVATEACAMRHELRAGADAAETVPPSASAGRVGGGASAAAVATTTTTTAATTAAAAAAAKAKAVAATRKRVQFFAFDFSTVDMPTDAIEDSDTAAKEVAQCLVRGVACAKVLRKALPKRSAGGRTSGDGGLANVLNAFMRGLKTVAFCEPSSSPLVASVRGACLELGNEVSGGVVKRAAAFLLQSLESLRGGPEAPARCPLRRRLAGMLSALIRYNLRVLLNPPPHKSVSSLHIAESTDRPRRVHEVIRLVSEETKPVNRKDLFDPTRDGATSAVVSRALRRLYGFTDKGAVEVMSTAEAFVADARSRSDISDEDKVLQARRHSQDTVDIVAAIRARSFLLELLEFPGVEVAVSHTRGWGEVERLSTQLREVSDTPDADASLTLLGEVGRLRAWLRQESPSPWQHDQRAKAVLTRLDEVLVGCGDKREAKRLSQEARRRMWFPRVKSPEPLPEVRV